jgi:hypothetical protein
MQNTSGRYGGMVPAPVAPDRRCGHVGLHDRDVAELGHGEGGDVPGRVHAAGIEMAHGLAGGHNALLVAQA